MSGRRRRAAHAGGGANDAATRGRQGSDRYSNSCLSPPAPVRRFR
jgi:hypothetical protein